MATGLSTRCFYQGEARVFIFLFPCVPLAEEGHTTKRVVKVKDCYYGQASGTSFNYDSTSANLRNA